MMRRRDFLELSALALGASALPRFARADETLLSLVSQPQDLATPLDYFDRDVTPTDAFFVRSHFGPPALRPNRRLRVLGLVDHPLDLSVAELGAFPEVTLTCVLQCAGNGRGLAEPRVPGVQWDQGAMGQASWTGVRLADVLGKAGVQKSAAHLRLLGADWPPKPTVPRYIRGFPLARALDSSTLLAYRMNGAPLPLAHGAPLRLVVPGWTGNHWVKWLTEIRLQDAEAEGFYMQTAYRLPEQGPVTTFPIKSVIARPADGATLPAGTHEIVGVAFAGTSAIARVEVSVDGGAHFAEARLEGEAAPGRWQVYRHRFTVTPGRYRAVVRATDRAGNTQPAKARWNPSGYLWNAWHAIAFTVAALVLLVPSRALADPNPLLADNCMGCHSDELLEQQRLTTKQWTAVIKKMQGWGAPIEDGNVDALVKDLAARFGVDAGVYLPLRVDGVAPKAALAPMPDGPWKGGNPRRGKTVYTSHCASCHGADGHGTPTGVNLADRPLLYRAPEFAAATRKPPGRMPPYGTELLKDADLASIIAYLRTL